jgi:DNA mismatch repair ATPase MutS
LAVAAQLAGLASARGWVVILVVQAVVAYRWGRRLQRESVLASKGMPELRFHHGVLAVWEGYQARAGLLSREVGRLGRDTGSASRSLSRLDRLLHLADVRHSSVYPVLEVGLLWNVHVARGLLAWRRRHGTDAEGWMDAMGRLEALSAMAAVAGDHPDWCWPRFDEGREHPRLSAEGLGHPLLHTSGCVGNDVELGPPGTVLLVTGSNMSGKSTLLRSVGLAVVMAEAGMPVCASRLTLPPVRLFTSMRVQDSLEAGVSYFMAELLRLKALLNAAEEGGGETRGRPLLYLVDEILQGTNSEERRVAGRRLIRHLLRRRALGAVTTHDLELHRDPEVEAAAVLVHFRESLDEAGAGLSFDYRLRQGLATTRNALRLAERVGITDPDA